MGYELSPQEKETIITFNEKDDKADVYTSSPRVATHLNKAGFKPYDKTHMNGTEVSWFFSIEKQAVRIKRQGGTAVRIGGIAPPKTHA